MAMWQIWLILAGFFIIIEAATIGFFFFWFSIGALIAMISSFFISSPVHQAYIFLISSTLLTIFTKPLVNRFKQAPTVKTNAYSVVNKKGKVTIDINPSNATGQVKVDGDLWSAKSINDEPIPVGTDIIVNKIDGVKLIVEKADATSII